MVPVPMMLDLDRLRASSLERDPFDFVIVDNFIRAECLPAAVADFPPLASLAIVAGSLLVVSLLNLGLLKAGYKLRS